MRKKNVLYKAAAVAVVVAVAVSLLMMPDRGMSKDKKAVDFTFNDLNDKPVKLSDYRGKIVLVNIWATWCPPCKAEIPGFINLYKKYKDKGLVIIGVSVDRGGKKVVVKFAADYNINYPILIGKDKQITKVFGPIRGIPTTFLIDPDGVIVNKYIGFHSEKKFEEEILKLLKKAAQPPF